MAKAKSETNSNSDIDNTSGPNLFSRDENGLLKNVQYSFNADGSINWREMVKKSIYFQIKAGFKCAAKICLDQ